ncbi:hypothetical protein GOODEAATRI_018214 [Goodea atripinnis]|uniref:DH domain-containing protein n=1 Tax=Goodea atripinnis TaxID=208336 RepID=A0ABV0P5W3_9TELE
MQNSISGSADARHQVAMQLLHSEWEYVSSLNQLYDKYKTPPAHQMTVEPHQTYVKFVEQLLQRHVLFRNTLQERLSAEHWKSLVGDILVQLIGQNDWTGKEHPDCSLLLGSERALRSILSRCHAILEDDVRWEEDEGAGQSPVRRKSFRRDQATLSQPAHNCGPACCSLLTPDATGWGENSDSGQGTYSHPTMKSTNDLETPHANHSLEGCETDPDDTSAFDYSSVTSCSPDGTLCRDMMMDTNSGEDDDDEEDSQVPVLLKPSYSRQQQEQQEQHSTEPCRPICGWTNAMSHQLLWKEIG